VISNPLEELEKILQKRERAEKFCTQHVRIKNGKISSLFSGNFFLGFFAAFLTDLKSGFLYKS
jgi:hypothetical protein